MAQKIAVSSTNGRGAEMAAMAEKAKLLRTEMIRAAEATGQWEAHTVESTSATGRFNKAILEEKVSVTQLIRALAGEREARALINASMKEQLALQNSLVLSGEKTAYGKQSATLLIPQGLEKEAFASEQRVGYLNKALSAASANTINWGKNTQWAGRQLTAGFTMPVLIAAAATGKLAYDMDAQLTHITKIYEYSTKETGAQAVEQAKLRADSIALATSAANLYGAKLQEVLQVEANFAATGITGNALMNDTNSVVRTTTLAFQGASASAEDYQNTFKATIAMQNIFKLSAKETNDAFNYMNVVESKTSLRMQDIVAAIPKSFGPLHDLGLSYQEITVLLVAMKQNGVTASQGANALKSAIGSLLHPSKAASETLRGLGINLKYMVEQAGGNVFTVLSQLSEKLKNVNTIGRETALVELFGKQQMARLTGVVDSLGDIHNQATQVGRAFSVSSMSAEEWATKSNEQLKKLHNSLSGQVRNSIATLQLNLAKLGETVLPIFAGMVNGVASIANAINGMPNGAKLFTLFAIGLAAVAGPIIMITGLFANWVGNIGKGVTALYSFRNNFKMLDPETKVQTELTGMLNNKFDAQTRSLGALGLSLESVTQTMKALNTQQGLAMDLANGVGRSSEAIVMRNAAGNLQYAKGSKTPKLDETGTPMMGPDSKPIMVSNGGRTVAKNSVDAKLFADEEAKAAASAEKVATQTERTGTAWGGVASKVGMTAMGVGMVGTMLAGNNQSLSRFFEILMGVGVVMSMLPMGAIVTSLKAALFTSEGLASVMGVAFAPLTLALAGLAAVVLAIKIIHDKMGELSTRQKAINEDTKTWGEILGFTYKESTINPYHPMTKAEQADKASIAEDIALVNTLKDKQKDLADQLANTTGEQNKENIAIQEGLKVASHGGDAAQSLSAVKTSLLAAGIDRPEVNKIMLRIGIDFGDPKQVVDQFLMNIQKQLDSSRKTSGDKSFWENFVDAGNQNFTLSDQSVRAADEAAASFMSVFQGIATTDRKGQSDTFQGLIGMSDQSMNQIFGDIKTKFGAQISTLGVSSANDIVNLIGKVQAAQDAGAKDPVATAFGNDAKAMDAYNKIMDVYGEKMGQSYALNEHMAQGLARKLNVDEKTIPTIHTLTDLQKALGLSFMTSETALNGYNRALRDALDKNPNLAEADKLAILNKYRLAAGLSEATSSTELFTVAIDANTAAKNSNSAAEGLSSTWVPASAQDLTSSLQSTMSGTMSTIYSEADRLLADHNKNVTDAITAGGTAAAAILDRQEKAKIAAYDRQAKALQASQTKETKAVTDSFDDKTKALKDNLKASTAADKVRQAIFDAELTRIQRLASAASRNIDFNAALSSGNLDEAAKISIDANAAVQTGILDDQKKRSAEALVLQQEGVQAQIDAIDLVKTATLDALKVKQDAQRQEVADAKAAAQQRTADAKAALQKQTSDRVNAVKEQQDASKRALDAELAALKAFVPKNAEELKQHIANVEAMYGHYGINLQANGNAWAKIVGDALTANVASAAASLKNGVKWGEVAKSIEAQMSGALGLSPDALMSFLKTGVFPTGSAATPGAASAKTPYYGPAHGMRNAGSSARHSGGVVHGNNSGITQAQRVGVTLSDSLHPSEVPTILKHGEFVMNEHAVARHGINAMNAMNNGKTFHHEGGMIGDSFGGTLIGAMLAGALASRLSEVIGQAGAGALDGGYGMGGSGAYGGSDMGGTQMQMASIIMNVGKAMGASQRDLVVSIMTALQESSLTNLNHGDRDSLGLFQQRPSQGWGTPQQIMDPKYAAHKFFESLFGLKDRDKYGTLGHEAQAVQRSAFPDAYDHWLATAEAIVSGTPRAAGTGGNGNLIPPDRDGTPQDRGGWTSHLGPGISQVVARVLAYIPGGQTITSAWRPQDIGNPNSPHLQGKAVDIGENAYSPAGSAEGDLIAATFKREPMVNQVLWKTMLGGNHFNHVHVGFRHGGGEAEMPQLKVGGEVRYDNTIANLHRKETVLTAPLSQQLKDGIAKIDSGTTDQYTVSIDLRGAVVRETVDIEKAVYDAINKRESRLGRSRVVK